MSFDSPSNSNSNNNSNNNNNGGVNNIDVISQASSDLLSEGTPYSDEEIDLSPTTTPRRFATAALGANANTSTSTSISNSANHTTSRYYNNSNSNSNNSTTNSPNRNRSRNHNRNHNHSTRNHHYHQNYNERDKRNLGSGNRNANGRDDNDPLTFTPSGPSTPLPPSTPSTPSTITTAHRHFSSDTVSSLGSKSVERSKKKNTSNNNKNNSSNIDNDHDHDNDHDGDNVDDDERVQSGKGKGGEVELVNMNMDINRSIEDNNGNDNDNDNRNNNSTINNSHSHSHSHSGSIMTNDYFHQYLDDIAGSSDDDDDDDDDDHETDDEQEEEDHHHHGIAGSLSMDHGNYHDEHGDGGEHHEHHDDNDDDESYLEEDDDYLDTISEEEEGVDYDNDEEDNDNDHDHDRDDDKINRNLSNGRYRYGYNTTTITTTTTNSRVTTTTRLGRDGKSNVKDKDKDKDKGKGNDDVPELQLEDIDININNDDDNDDDNDNDNDNGNTKENNVFESDSDNDNDGNHNMNTNLNMDMDMDMDTDTDIMNDDAFSFDDSTDELHDSLIYDPNNLSNSNVVDEYENNAVTTDTTARSDKSGTDVGIGIGAVRPTSATKTTTSSSTISTTTSTTNTTRLSLSSPSSKRTVMPPVPISSPSQPPPLTSTTLLSSSSKSKRKTRDFDVAGTSMDSSTFEFIHSQGQYEEDDDEHDEHDEHEVEEEHDHEEGQDDEGEDGSMEEYQYTKETTSYHEYSNDPGYPDEADDALGGTENVDDDDDHDVNDTLDDEEEKGDLDVGIDVNADMDADADEGVNEKYDTFDNEPKSPLSKTSSDHRLVLPPDIQSILDRNNIKLDDETSDRNDDNIGYSSRNGNNTGANANVNVIGKQPSTPQSDSSTTISQRTTPPSGTRRFVKLKPLKPFPASSPPKQTTSTTPSSILRDGSNLKHNQDSPAFATSDPPPIPKSSSKGSNSNRSSSSNTTTATNVTVKSKTARLTSPFSPKARRLRTSKMSTPRDNLNIRQQNLNWSMAPSRKVSILVNVAPNLNLPISTEEEESSLCLYPNLAQQYNLLDGGYSDSASLSTFASNFHHASVTSASPARSIKSSYSVTSQTSIFHKAPTQPSQEIMLVNPGAFGKIIPTSVTVETAKLVASIRNISSEDWVRKFKFDEVCWPHIRQLIGITKNNTNDTVKDIGKAIVCDVKEGRGGRCVFGYGTKDSGRVESLFGFVAGNHSKGPNSNGERSGSSSLSGIENNFMNFNDDENVMDKSIGLKLGLLGYIITNLMGQDDHDEEIKEDQYESQDSNGIRFTLSMIEIAGEDVLRDLLLPTSPNPSSSKLTNGYNSKYSPSGRLLSPSERSNGEKVLKIRHPDTRGAIVQNAIEEEIGNIAHLETLMKRAFHSKSAMKARRLDGGRGHIIATLKVYLSPSNKEERKNPTRSKNLTGKADDYVLIQLVDLASAETEQMDQPFSSGRSKIEMRRIQDRRISCIRKSMSGLRGILRTLIKQEVQKTNQTMSYRECTLTKLVQRTLDYQGSRAVVIATVCPRRQSYNKTLDTLNYMHRLLVKPNKTAESPFETKNDSDSYHSPSFGGQYRSPSGDQSVTSYASSVASEAIQTEFMSADAKKEYLKSLVTDPRQRLATLLTKSPSKNEGPSSEMPLKEITTIKEIEKDTSGDNGAFDTALNHLDDVGNDKNTSYDFENGVSFDSSLMDKSYDKATDMEDPSELDESQDIVDSSEYDNNNVKTEPNQEKSTIFDEVLEQLDELDSKGVGQSFSESEDSVSYTASRISQQELINSTERPVVRDSQPYSPTSSSQLSFEPLKEYMNTKELESQSFHENIHRNHRDSSAQDQDTVKSGGRLHNDYRSVKEHSSEKYEATGKYISQSNAPSHKSLLSPKKGLFDSDDESFIALNSPHKINRAIDPFSEDDVPSDLVYAASDESISDVEKESASRQENNKVKGEKESISGTSRDDLDRKLSDLEKSIQLFVESTNEPDLINDLTADRIKLDHSLLSPGGNTMARKVAQLTAKTEALQTYVTSTQNQLERSRAAENAKQQQILELNHRMEETQEEIQALKSSASLTIDQIQHDHFEALQMERNKAVQNAEEIAYSLKRQLDREVSSRQKLETDHANEKTSLMESLGARAEENKLLMEKLSDLEKELRGYQQAREHESQELSSLKQTLNQRKEEGNAEKQKLSEANEDLRARLENEISENKTASKQNAQNISLLEKAVNTLQAEKDNLKDNLGSVKKENIALQKHLTSERTKAADDEESHRKKLSSLVEVLDERNEENSRLAERLELLEQNYKEKEDAEAKLSKETFSLQARLNDSLIKQVELEKNLGTTKDKNMHLNRELLDERQRHKEIELEHDRNCKSTIEKALNDYNKDKARLLEELDRSKNRNMDVEEQLNIEVKKRQEVEVELKLQSESLEDALNDCKNHKENLIKKLEDFKKDNMKLNEMLAVETKERKAMELELENQTQLLEEALNNCNEDKVNLLNDLNALGEEKLELIEKMNVQSDKIKDQEERHNTLEKKLKESNESKTNLMKELNSAKDDKADLTRKLLSEIDRRNEIELDLRRMERSLQDAVDEFSDEKEELIDLLENANQSKEELSERLAVEVKKRKDIESTHSEQLDSHNRLIASYDAARKQVDDLQNQIRTEKGKREAAEKKHIHEVSRLSTEIQDHEDTVRTISEDMESLKNERKQLQESLDVERSRRAEEKAIYTSKISLMSERESEKQEKMMEKIRALKDEMLERQKSHELEMKRKNDVEEEYSQNLSSLKNNLAEKDDKVKELKDTISGLVEQINEFQEIQKIDEEERNQLIDEHDKKVSLMNSLISKNNDIIESQADKISSLQAETDRLCQNLEEEVEEKIRSTNSYVDKISSLHETAKKAEQEKDNLSREISILRSELDQANDQVLSDTDTKKALQNELIALKTTSRDLKEEKSNLLSQTLSLEEKTISLSNLLEKEKKLRSKANDELLAISRRHEDEITKLQRTLDEKEGRGKSLTDEVIVLKSQLGEEKKSINELKETYRECTRLNDEEISHLKKALTDEKKQRLNDLKSMKQSMHEDKHQFETELLIVKKSLETKTKKNQKLKDLLTELQSDRNQTEETLKADLNVSKGENSKLSEALKRVEADLYSQISELKKEKEEAVEKLKRAHDDVLSKLSNARYVKETLAEQNDNLCERLDEMTKQKEKAEEKKNKIYKSLKESEDMMRTEMKEIRSAMELAMSKKNKDLDRERKLSLATTKKYEAKIEELETELKERNSYNSRSENMKLRKQITALEEKIRNNLEKTNERNFDSYEDDDSNKSYIVLWRSEREQRIKAEEFAAAMAARAKSGFEERDERIVNLRMKVSRLESEKDYKSKHSTHDTNPLLTNGDHELMLALRERDAAIDEAKRFRAIARKLNDHLSQVDHELIEHGTTIPDDFDSQKKDRTLTYIKTRVIEGKSTPDTSAFYKTPGRQEEI